MTVSPAAAEHFEPFRLTGQDPQHPVITQIFWSGRWRRYPAAPRVTDAELRVLRGRGVTHVQLSAYNHTADFRMTTLLTTRRHP